MHPKTLTNSQINLSLPRSDLSLERLTREDFQMRRESTWRTPLTLLTQSHPPETWVQMTSSGKNLGLFVVQHLLSNIGLEFSHQIHYWIFLDNLERYKLRKVTVLRQLGDKNCPCEKKKNRMILNWKQMFFKNCINSFNKYH